MFIGAYDHSLDPKGRVILPRKFRDELGQDMVFTKGIERCLYLFPQAEFAAFAAKLQALPITQRPGRDLCHHADGSQPHRLTQLDARECSSSGTRERSPSLGGVPKLL